MVISIELIWFGHPIRSTLLKTLPSVSVFVLDTQITTSDGTVIKLTLGSVVKRNGENSFALLILLVIYRFI
jgi:hypothetical protein